MNKKDIIVGQNSSLQSIVAGAGFSYAYFQKLLRNKDIKVNGKRVAKDLNVTDGDIVEIYYKDIPKRYEILYEDANIVVVNKFTGIEIEGCGGLCEQIGNVYAVHRLDRNTCGLVVLAKSKAVQAELVECFKAHHVTKMYLAEVVGRTNFAGEIYTAYLEKNAKESVVKIYDVKKPNTVQIKTQIKTLKSGEISLLQVGLITGKTHQIRAHLAHLGCAIVGDGKYGKNCDNKKFKANSQRLFCYYIKFENLSDRLEYLNKKEFKILPNFIKNAKICENL